MHYSIRDFMHNLAVTVVVSEISYTQADLCIIILCIMRMSTVCAIFSMSRPLSLSARIRLLQFISIKIEEALEFKLREGYTPFGNDHRERKFGIIRQSFSPKNGKAELIQTNVSLRLKLKSSKIICAVPSTFRRKAIRISEVFWCW